MHSGYKFTSGKLIITWRNSRLIIIKFYVYFHPLTPWKKFFPRGVFFNKKNSRQLGGMPGKQMFCAHARISIGHEVG